MTSEISQTEKGRYCLVLLICGVYEKNKLIETENRWVVVREGASGMVGEGDQKPQTSSNKINRSWGCNVYMVIRKEKRKQIKETKNYRYENKMRVN